MGLELMGDPSVRNTREGGRDPGVRAFLPGGLERTFEKARLCRKAKNVQIPVNPHDVAIWHYHWD